jgi:hypothetical protein
LSIQGQAIRAASSGSDAMRPSEISFLSRHGVQTSLLRQAAEIAAAVGISADEAMLRCDLLDEATFFKALADELGLPFLARIRVDDRARYPESILAGLVQLAPGLGAAHYAVAPAGDALTRLLIRRPKVNSGLAITTPSALRASVLDARPRTIAWHAANELPESKPAWSYRDGASYLQIGWGAAFIGCLASRRP